MSLTLSGADGRAGSYGKEEAESLGTEKVKRGGLGIFLQANTYLEYF